MNKQTIALIIAGTALAAGGGFYLYRRSKSQQVIDQYGTTTQSPGIVQSGQNLLNTGQSVISQVQSILKPSSSATTSEYEGKLIRVAKGPVYFVLNNLLHYISKLPTPDGRFDWTRPVPIEVKSTSIPEGESYDSMMAKYIDPTQPWLGLKGLGRIAPRKVSGMGEVMVPVVQRDGSVIYTAQAPDRSLGDLPVLLTLN
jgi:LPXTG-motif cell wall-anchored protein